jgi:hypothetical protein
MGSQPARVDGKEGDWAGPRRCLLYRGEEYALGLGQHLIGRHASCELTIEDPLVSRRHARLVVSEQSVLVQDLDSENGVFLNERRITSPSPLRDGDRILVGTQEISFFLRSRGAEKCADSGDERLSAAVCSASLPPQLQPQSGHSTLHADAFVYLGRVADRMLATDRPEAAERILDGHLKDVAHAARLGEKVEPELLDSAAQYALKLARATRNGQWIDYAVELHLLYRRPMQAILAQSLRLLFNRIPNASTSLLREYQAVLLATRPGLSRGEQRLVDQLLGIEPHAQ